MSLRSVGGWGVVAVSLLVAGCDIRTNDGFELGFAAARAEDTWTRSYTLERGGRLEIINVNGRIDAELSEGASVEILARRSAKATSEDAAKALLSQIEMREEPGPSKVRVEVRPPRTRGLSGHEIRWTVKVPRGVHVDFRTLNGGVYMNRLDGPIQARVTNGGVFGRLLASTQIEGRTVNGGVQIELGAPLPSDGEVELACVNGGVTLSLPGESKATIDARAVNGGVSASGLNLEPTGEQTRRRVSGTMNGGGARVSVETTNGGVRITKVASGTN